MVNKTFLITYLTFFWNIYKVQSDIQQIKNDVLANLLNGDSIDPHRIKSLFEKAEKDIEVLF